MFAQSAESEAISTAPTIVVEDESKPAQTYRFGSAADSGTSTFSRESIETRAPGDGDVNRVLKALPTVQFSTRTGRTSDYDLLDLRPEDLSISGGRHTENLFMIDGVGVNSRLDVSSTNPNHFIEGNAAASAQTVWVDANLVGSITVRDSNVSAQFGQFSGGVVEITTRRPSADFGVEAYYGETNDSLTSFVLSDSAKKIWKGQKVPDAPEYTKRRYGLTVDLPVHERVRLLAAYTVQEAETIQNRAAAYAKYGEYGLSSLKQTVLLKGEVDLPNGLLLSGQINWSPFESQSANNNGIDNRMTLNGGGVTASMVLAGSRGPADWELELTHATSDNDRNVEHPGMVTVSTAGSGIDWCSGTSCTRGGSDPLYQRQIDTGLKGSWQQPLGAGDLSVGFEVANVSAEKSRPFTVYTYRHGASAAAEIGANTVCADPNEGYSCVTGQYALAQRNTALKFHTEVDLQTYGLWGEYDFDLAGFMIRTGLRYEHDSFLGNHDFAPRLSVSRDLPWGGINLTAGVNRYYSRSFLGYALREGYPATSYIYRRTPTISGGKRIWSDNWTLYLHSETAKYSNADLDTPYTDEFSLAAQGLVPWIGGEYRMKGILRKSRDQFSSSSATTETYDKDTGTTATRSVYTITNDGEREYRGLSIEYARDFGRNHTFSASFNASKTQSSNISYFDIVDETEYEGDFVYYKGKLTPLLRAIADNQLEDYAAPYIINADWSSTWWDGRVRTNINARYKSGFERVDDTGVNIRIDGVNYDVYDKVRTGESLEVNLALSADVAKTSFGAGTIDVRIDNLFDTAPNDAYPTSTISPPYQLGRSFWLGFKYRY